MADQSTVVVRHPMLGSLEVYGQYRDMWVASVCDDLRFRPESGHLIMRGGEGLDWIGPDTVFATQEEAEIAAALYMLRQGG